MRASRRPGCTAGAGSGGGGGKAGGRRPAPTVTMSCARSRHMLSGDVQPPARSGSGAGGGATAPGRPGLLLLRHAFRETIGLPMLSPANFLRCCLTAPDREHSAPDSLLKGLLVTGDVSQLHKDGDRRLCSSSSDSCARCRRRRHGTAVVQHDLAQGRRAFLLQLVHNGQPDGMLLRSAHLPGTSASVLVALHASKGGQRQAAII